MDSFELNKVAGAVLGVLLFAVGSGFIAELIYHPKPAGTAGYDLPEAKEEAAAAPEAAKVEPIAVRLASANIEKGQGGTKACQACHNFEKGGPNKVGPNLYDVVERRKGGHEGFEYSAGMKEKGGAWTYADLDGFLENPKTYVKGTKMAYAGIAAPQERGNVIAYLRTLSEAPKPLPAAEKAAEAKPTDTNPAEAKPAAGSADAKPADKPTSQRPATGKASEGKDSPAKPADINAASVKPVTEKPPGAPAPATSNENRNAVEQKPPAESSGPSPSTAAPAAPAAPPAAATLPPAKADAAAEGKAQDLKANGSDQGAPADKPQ
ncbi:c-type cytochrome [uncultured Methylobacterium sp.]|uniref:c-type cytochrome n=1 Tax=uncultured Methylobacterium sp. TaxID=157278 RepID=UPI0035CAA267